MKQNRIVGVIVLVVMVIVALGFFESNKKLDVIVQEVSNTPVQHIEVKEVVEKAKVVSNNNVVVESPTQTAKTEEVKTFNSVATLKIGGGSFRLDFNKDESLYNTLNRLKAAGVITMSGKEYSGLGFFVSEINGLKSSGGKSIIYYVNSEKASIGISNLKLNPEDIIEFKVEDNY